MSIKEILKIPYIMFVVGMIDAPGIDYDSKKKDDDKITTPKNAQEEINAVIRGLG